ncbi:MAG: 16S rRNA (uracil(1498)-N(3))-methyltransferase [Kiritimatiellae bacterium]|nr:16S rRNA (uracil(1498)-N(3))-methyltransferase [Kiritimatiellia bacterium]MDW8457529.1 RsmE family RNA methyltransferase [Verrucomicrobiota bacterium]
MNLILLRAEDVDECRRARIGGPAARHVREVLRAKVGDTLRIGLQDGPIGIGRITELRNSEIIIECEFQPEAPRRPPVSLLIALPRPKAMKRLWPQVAALGVDRIFVTNAARVDRNYFDTHVLEPAFFTPLLIEGLQQAQDTRIPIVEIHRRLKPLIEDRLAAWPTPGSRILLHPPAPTPLLRAPARRPALIAIGPEGGWTPYEVDLFVRHGFLAASLGKRTLRTDTASIAALSILHAMFDFDEPSGA